MIRPLAAIAGVWLIATPAAALTAYDSLAGGLGSGIAIGGSSNYSSAVVFTPAESGTVDSVTAEFFALSPNSSVVAALYEADTRHLIDSVAVRLPADQSDEDALSFTGWDAYLEADMDYYLTINASRTMQIAWAQSPETRVGTFVEDIRLRDGQELSRGSNNFAFAVQLTEVQMPDTETLDQPTAVPLPASALILGAGLVALGVIRKRPDS